MKHYLQLVNWPSLVVLVIAQFLIKYALFEPFGLPITLNWFGLSLLSLSTVSLAAAGHTMEAITEAKANKFKPSINQLIGKKIKEKTAYRLFVGLNILGVGIGFYLANIIGYPSFAILFILVSALLHARASGLKRTVIIRPLILAVLMGVSLIGVGLFDLFPSLNEQNRQTIRTFFSILVDYSLFIGLLVFYRELLLDQIRINKDYKLQRNSLSIALGKERAAKAVIFVGALPVVALGYYLYTYLYLHNLFFGYALLLLFGPLCFILIKLISAKKDEEYQQLSLVLNFVILFSLLSIALFQFIIN